MTSSIYTPDQALLHALQSEEGLEGGVRTLYREHYKVVRAYVLKNSGQEADSEDIFQEVVVTFIDLVRQGKFREESSVSTFLYSLARHAWLNQLKKKGRDRIREEKYEGDREKEDRHAAQVMKDSEAMKVLMGVVHRLGDTCKKILIGFYFEKKSMKELLGVVNYDNEQIIRNKKYKCLKQLEEWVSGDPTLADHLRSILSYE